MRYGTTATLSLSVMAAVGMTLASSALMPSAAQAFTLSINPQFGSTENTGATATLDFDFVQQGNNVLLNLGIVNTTNGTAGLGATQATLVGVAVDLLAGPVTSFAYNAGSSAFTNTYNNLNIPGSFGSIVFDYGIRSEGPGNFVGGNPQQGLTAGQSAVVSFLLSGSSALNAAAVEQSFFSGYSSGSLSAAGRFQQVDAGGGSDKVLGGNPTPDNPPSAAVPEPASMLGMLAAGAMFLNRKKLQRKATLAD